MPPRATGAADAATTGAAASQVQATSAASAGPGSSNDVPTPQTRFLQALQAALDAAAAGGHPLRLGLRHPGPQADPELRQADAQWLVLRGVPHLQAVLRYARRDETRNWPFAEAAARIGALLDGVFTHAHLQSGGEDLQLRRNRKGRWVLQRGRTAPAEGLGATPSAASSTVSAASAARAPVRTASAPAAARKATPNDGGIQPPNGVSQTPDDSVDPTGLPALTHARTAAPDRDAGSDTETDADTDAGYLPQHNRARQYRIPQQAPFLHALGVTDAQARVLPTMARKWRQINKFVEIVEQALDRSGVLQRRGTAAAPLRIVDLGAGRGYLTLALHHALRARGLHTELLGIELRSGLVDEVNGVIGRLQLPGVRFEARDIASLGRAPLDLLIALHACDTATDLALHHGIASGCALIVCAPCCHQQLRPQLQAPPLLAPMLRHGILASDQAERLTDALRAQWLAACGWSARLFEFISPEATAKNRMLLAVQDPSLSPARRSQAEGEGRALMAHFGVREQALLTLLERDGHLPVA